MEVISLAASVIGVVHLASHIRTLSLSIRDVHEAESSCRELVQEVNDLDAMLRAIERIGHDKLDEAEVELINSLSEQSRPNVARLLEHLAATSPSSDSNRRQIWRKRKKRVLRPGTIDGLRVELRHATGVARILLANAERAGTLATASSGVDINLPSSNILQKRRNIPSQSISQSTPTPCIAVKRPHTCVLIFMMFFTFVFLSCFLGIYFTLDKTYGYSMGDAFTLVGWVVAVGAFISSGVLAQHYPRCKCWERSTDSRRTVMRIGLNFNFCLSEMNELMFFVYFVKIYVVSGFREAKEHDNL